MPVPDFYSPELIRKVADAVEEEDYTYPYFSSDARRALFNRARDAGELDDLAAEQIAEQERIDVEDVDPDQARNFFTVEDLRDEIPFNELDVDPDNERYDAYRLAGQDPKARQFFINYLQNNPDTSPELSDRVYEDVITGRLDRRDLDSLRESFRSDVLNDNSPGFSEWEAANFVEREGTRGRSEGLDRDIYEGFTAAEEDLDRLRLIANLPSNLETERNTIRGTIDRRFNEISRESDPLFTPQLYDRLDEISSRVPSETIPATLQDALDQRNILNQIQRDLSTFNTTSPYARRINSGQDYASDVLPSVRRVIGEDAAINAARRVYQESRTRQNTPISDADADPLLFAQRLAERANRAAARMRPGEQRELIERALENIQQTPLREVQLDEPFDVPTRSRQRIIPGLQEDLSRVFNDARLERGSESLENFKQVLQEFPELKDLVYGVENQNPRQRVKQELFKPYMQYVDTEQTISTPADRAALYNKILSSYGDPEFKKITLDLVDQIETLYSSGDPKLQAQARALIREQGFENELRAIEQSAFRPQRPIVGGGGYVNVYDPSRSEPEYEEEVRNLTDRINRRARKFNSAYKQVLEILGPNLLEQQFPGLARSSTNLPTNAAFSFNPDTKEVMPAAIGDPDAYEVKVSPANPQGFLVKRINDILSGSTEDISLNTLRFLADNPVTGKADISFDTRKPNEGWASYVAATDLPKEVTDKFEQFIRNRAMAETRPGTLVYNSPMPSDDLLKERLKEGETADTSSTVRKLLPFKTKNQNLPNLRGAAYMSAGFGPVDNVRTQYAYVDLQGNVIPLQPKRAEPALRGTVTRAGESFRVDQDVLPLSGAPRYFSTDPVASTGPGALALGRALRRTPSALLPGAADLIPSPEAIQTGYARGPVAMGRQMGQEFIQSLPVAAGTAGFLATPLAAPFAPGVGAGFVGTAGARALNEVVRQETGEGIVPKLRQFIGTAPRTGATAQPRTGEKPLTATLKPLTSAQRSELTRQDSRNEIQKRIDLVKERFNPRRGEFGLSELLLGR